MQNKMILKSILTLAALAVISGCSNAVDTSASKMTQPIAPEQTLVSSGHTAPEDSASGHSSADIPASGGIPSQATGPNASLPGTASGASAEDLFDAYFSLKAQEKAIEIEIDLLKADFRIGKLAETDFQQQKTALEAQEEEVDQQREHIKHALRTSGAAHIPKEAFAGIDAAADLDSLLTQLETLENEDDTLDFEEDQLEEDYRSGKITCDVFLEKQKELERRSDELDALDDYLEDRLEQLGWDD